MSKSIFTIIAFIFLISFAKAQTTAMQLNGLDCNGNPHDLFADLDAGKAVLLHFFMPSCGSCVPPAKKIVAMANKVLATHPGMITAYAMPYNDITTCAYTATWVTSPGLTLYTPYDSGATQVAYYGGFGMPTVVLLGGSDHRVMFSTKTFVASDTTIMRDSILALLDVATNLTDLPSAISSFDIFPNPAKDIITVNIELKETSDLLVDVTDIRGKQVALIMNEIQYGIVTKQFSTAALSSGIYMVRMQTKEKTLIQKLTITH